MQTESVKSRKEGYCDGEPTESIRALLLLAKMSVRCNGRKKYASILKDGSSPHTDTRPPFEHSGEALIA